MNRLIPKSKFYTTAVKTSKIFNNSPALDPKLQSYKTQQRLKTLKLTTDLLSSYDTETELYTLGVRYLRDEITESEYY